MSVLSLFSSSSFGNSSGDSGWSSSFAGVRISIARDRCDGTRVVGVISSLEVKTLFVFWFSFSSSSSASSRTDSRGKCTYK
jgi:hypothetical protein